MKTRQPNLFALAIIVALVLASGTLLANGETFFVPAVRGPVNLVYFARVKNSRTGRPIEKPPYVTIVDPYTGLIMPFVGDSPGHFRSRTSARRSRKSRLILLTPGNWKSSSPRRAITR